MKPFQANIINGVALVTMSLWGYFSSENPSPTAFIPTAFGVLFLVMHPGLKKENKIVAHIIVILTLVVLVSLYKPFSGAMERGDNLAILRIAIMILAGIVAMITFVKSFIDARRAKE